MTKGSSEHDSNINLGVYWLECSSCRGWEIFENTGLPGPYNEKIARKAKFSCKLCAINKKIDAFFSELNKIRTQLASANLDSWADMAKKIPTEIKESRDKIVELCDNNCRLISEISSVKESISKSSHTENTLSAPQLRQASSEVLDIENRKLSLVIAGLPEKGSDITDFIDFCNTHHTLDKPISTTDVESAVRFGRAGTPGAPKMMRIKITSQAVRKSLLVLHFKRLPTAPSVYIRPDLTKAQLEVDKRLREELKEKGKEHFKIFRGKVIPRDGAGKQDRPKLISSATAKVPDNTVRFSAPSTSIHSVPIQVSKRKQVRKLTVTKRHTTMKKIDTSGEDQTASENLLNAQSAVSNNKQLTGPSTATSVAAITLTPGLPSSTPACASSTVTISQPGTQAPLPKALDAKKGKTLVNVSVPEVYLNSEPCSTQATNKVNLSNGDALFTSTQMPNDRNSLSNSPMSPDSFLDGTSRSAFEDFIRETSLACSTLDRNEKLVSSSEASMSKGESKPTFNQEKAAGAMSTRATSEPSPSSADQSSLLTGAKFYRLIKAQEGDDHSNSTRGAVTLSPAISIHYRQPCTDNLVEKSSSTLATTLAVTNTINPVASRLPSTRNKSKTTSKNL